MSLQKVWADGLGNPFDNSLPRCQVIKVAQLVETLQESVAEKNGGSGSSSGAYRFWVDPFCCPVEPEGKRISLQRIAAVYRNAAHVLVLDKSLSSVPAEGVHPAELALRAVGESPWMRRLWTLQGPSAPFSTS